MILTTKQVPAAVKAGRIKSTYFQTPEGEGYVYCGECGKDLGRTASPDYWRKGDTCFCNKCKKNVVVIPIFPGKVILDLSR